MSDSPHDIERLCVLLADLRGRSKDPTPVEGARLDAVAEAAALIAQIQRSAARLNLSRQDVLRLAEPAGVHVQILLLVSHAPPTL